MAPKRDARPIPTGWTLETEVQKDGSKLSFYYCPGTGQHFFTYSDLMRYVEYAKNAGVGIYSPSFKSLKRKRSIESDKTNTITATASASTESRKTSSGLSIVVKASITVNQSIDAKSSVSVEITDKEKDQDYVSESEGDVSDDFSSQ
ncbi:uncharacterized protein LOC133286754 [Gastrolobium bilobum]|uniref:uncharacterized protein LOC133286754 n=1 Tax=Gastrolobium bilobum TaxID=150636 RepID=UPI002AB0F0E9|nr:uncharacterized protein LOC133286754 [Gastrolobium bilobum]XP_061340190.1 uncharacterized protein LOC133286754 [Gastrolobium bilobum]